MTDSLTAKRALREHFPEYMIEAWALGMFMISAGVFTILIEHPHYPLREFLQDSNIRRLLIGVAMGMTAVALIYSAWGKRSGAHMNPAVTIAFLRLGTMHRWDAFFYIVFQTLGGLAGVLLVQLVFGEAFTAAPVNHVITKPGEAGVGIAFAAEFFMSALLMFTILAVSSHPRLERFTGIAAGVLVATYIAVEAPFSGMSINPARTLASSLPAGEWDSWWLYLVAPVGGMLTGVEFHRGCWPRTAFRHAKLVWCEKQRCIHSGYVPGSRNMQSPGTGPAKGDERKKKVRNDR